MVRGGSRRAESGPTLTQITSARCAATVSRTATRLVTAARSASSAPGEGAGARPEREPAHAFAVASDAPMSTAYRARFST